MRPLLNVRDLTIEFPQSRAGQALSSTQPGGVAGPVTAVRSLSFSIAPGEVLGLVGESGSGKSITSLAIMGLLPPAAIVRGEITFQNGDGPPTHLTTLPSDQLRQLRGSRMAMIFQEPMTALNPVMRVGDQIAEAVLAHHHVSKSEAWRQAVEGMRDVAIADPEQRARSYPHQLSGGMRQRVMIAMAIVNRPQLLIADEPTTALDVTIQQQILDLLNDLRHKFGLAMLFISHDLAVVSHVAERARHLGVKMVVCLGPLLVLAWVIVIACYSAATSDVLNAVLPDTSFTGRTDVWRFAIDHAMERPITGHGFMAFWRTRDVFSAEMANFWANLAAHSHDGYMDIALTTGLPGLAFTLILIVVMPLINFHNRANGETNCVLSLLFLRFWLFGIYVNCFESALFDRGNRIWFFLLSASFGLHFLARYRIRA